MKPLSREWHSPTGDALGTEKTETHVSFAYISTVSIGVNQMFCTVRDVWVTTTDWMQVMCSQDMERKYFVSDNANDAVYDITVRERRYLDADMR